MGVKVVASWLWVVVCVCAQKKGAKMVTRWVVVCVYAKRCFLVELEVLSSGFEVSLEAGVIKCAKY